MKWWAGVIYSQFKIGMEEKGPKAAEEKEERKDEQREKEKQPVNPEQLKQRRQRMLKMFSKLEKNDETLNLIQLSEEEQELLNDKMKKLLEVGGDFYRELKQVEEKHTELQRKREEEEKRKRLQRQKEEEQEREKQRKIEEERRREEEERKRQQKIAFFKKEREEAGARVKALKECITKEAETKPEDQNIQPLLQFIENKRSEVARLQEKRGEECKSLERLKSLADELGDTIPLDPRLPELAELLQNRISALYSLEERAYQKNRQDKTQKIREDHPFAPIPTDFRPYNPVIFYELQISTLRENSLAKLQQLPPEEQESETAKVESVFVKLKAQQKFINQIKIFIELYQVDAEVLQKNKFDFAKYSELLARKAQLIREKGEGGEGEGEGEFGKIEEEMNAMTGKLNTNDFLMPFKYPLDLLVRAKNHLVTEYFEKQAKELEESVKEQQTATGKLEASLSELQQKVTAKKQELKQTQEQFNLFLQSLQRSVNQSLAFEEQQPEEQQPKKQQPEGMQPEQLQNEPRDDLGVVLQNQEEISALYAEIRDNQRSNEAAQMLEVLRAKRAALQEQFQYLNERFIATPLNIEEHLRRTIEVQEAQQLKEEEELARLLMQCEEIERRRQEEGRPEEHSGFSRYSSIIF